MALLSAVRGQQELSIAILPVILMSGNTTADVVISARNLGATEFLAKPLTAESLYTRVAGVIERPRNFVRTTDYFGPDRRRQKKKVLAGRLRRATDS